VTKPEAQAINVTTIGIQAPFPSDWYPSGQTLFTGEELGTQFPFPSLTNPESHTTGIKSETQFPYPSLWYPVEQTI
jgi:hypothetical protein